jgi:hypothetical protein
MCFESPANVLPSVFHVERNDTRALHGNFSTYIVIPCLWYNNGNGWWNVLQMANIITTSSLEHALSNTTFSCKRLIQLRAR